MIDLNMPLAPDPDPARTAKEVQRLCIAEGRAAYRAGCGPKPPPYRDPDMVLDWSNGYRWEKEERPRR